MNEISESANVRESSVTCLMERDAITGISRNAQAVIMMPWNTLSRKMPLRVILIIDAILFPS
jgi:hypothetical protein